MTTEEHPVVDLASSEESENSTDSKSIVKKSAEVAEKPVEEPTASDHTSHKTEKAENGKSEENGTELNKKTDESSETVTDSTKTPDETNETAADSTKKLDESGEKVVDSDKKEDKKEKEDGELEELDTKTEAKSTNGVAEHTNGVSEELNSKILRQIEYYFGNYNLPRDKFLKEQVCLVNLVYRH